jgi:MYXO-CTERM domain-containing protein
MARVALFLLAGLIAAPLCAEVLADFSDNVNLRDGETIRYAIDIDYGFGDNARIEVFARGFDGRPRVRILDHRKKVIKSSKDTDGDWTVNPSKWVDAPDTRFYVELDNAVAWHGGYFEIDIMITADEGNFADAQVRFDKYFFDRSHKDHGCTSGAGGIPFAMLLVGAGAVWLRRRRTTPRLSLSRT